MSEGTTYSLLGPVCYACRFQYKRLFVGEMQLIRLGLYGIVYSVV